MSTLDSFVIYYSDNIPLGVVSDNHICRAETYNIPEYLKKIIVSIEDKRFYNHYGIDAKAIMRALIYNIRSNSIKQGGSTLTQQLARNLLENNTKNILRKIKEALKAINLERKYSKDEIIQLYFNNVYFGKNLRGIRSASLYYFGKEIEFLSDSRMLYLVTLLRGPNFYLNNPYETENRYRFLNKFLFDKKISSFKTFKKNSKFKIQTNVAKLSLIRPSVIPFITSSIDLSKKTVLSTINNSTQNFANKFVNDSNYPVSIIALQNGKIIAFASSYGSEYPFQSRSNVGSTLKPFIYCHLRKQGVSLDTKFPSTRNSLNWNVREANGNFNTELSIDEALFLSNNNAFINASNTVGVEFVLDHLSSILNIESEKLQISSILGSTSKGLTLYELASIYSEYFKKENLDPQKTECLNIMCKIFRHKTGLQIENIFLKTGTTNGNKERYAILGNSDTVYTVLRNENPLNDDSKEGGFISNITKNIKHMFRINKNYRWI